MFRPQKILKNEKKYGYNDFYVIKTHSMFGNRL